MSDEANGRTADDALTPEEREWLGTVPERVDPPPELRRRVVERLAAEGQLTASGEPAVERRRRGWALAAALAAMFVAGAGLERASVLPTPPGPAADRAATADGARYVLLLHEDASYDPGGRTGPELVEEYAAWAGDLAADGRLVLAEKLAEDGVVVDRSGTEPGSGGASTTGGEPRALTGLFIIRASSYGEAARIARGSPHARYGGAVVIRRVDPT